MSRSGYIYKLVCNDIEVKECYVGSTTNMKVRKYSHKTRCNNTNDKKHHYQIYQFIRANGCFNNWSMIQLEEFKFNTRQELAGRERHWFETLQATLNVKTPARTHKEYYQDNSELVAKKKSEYSNKCRERLTKYHKEWYNNNKEKRLQKYKIYRDNNKTIIYEKAGQKIMCECGSTLRKSDIAHHKKSKKHKQWESLYNYIHS